MTQGKCTHCRVKYVWTGLPRLNMSICPKCKNTLERTSIQLEGFRVVNKKPKLNPNDHGTCENGDCMKHCGSKNLKAIRFKSTGCLFYFCMNCWRKAHQTEVRVRQLDKKLKEHSINNGNGVI